MCRDSTRKPALCAGYCSGKCRFWRLPEHLLAAQQRVRAISLPGGDRRGGRTPRRSPALAQQPRRHALH